MTMFTPNLRRTTDNRLVPVSIGALAMKLRGELQLLNGAAESSNGPAMIVRCTDLNDATECINFATRNGLLIVMHNSQAFPGTEVNCDHGIVVDLGSLARVT
jgi:hypothetical protein